MVEVVHASPLTGVGEGSSSQRSVNMTGYQISSQEGDSTTLDGRTTPTPESESANHLSRQSSSLQTSDPPPQIAFNSATNDEIGSGSQQGIRVINAEVGFGPLQGEEQLKKSLQGKDRLFLLVLAKEMEAFIDKVGQGQEPNIIPSIPLATTSTSIIASMTASFAIASHISSTFQRMLVYKAADWYGLRAVNTPEVSILVGVVGTMDPRSAILRLSDLAPRADSPPQKFRIMQRGQGNSANSPNFNGTSRSSSVVADDGGSESSSSRVKTLEEREAAYNKARERIYGSTDGGEETAEAASTVRGIRPAQYDVDDFETAPRIPPSTTEPTFQPVYPSLYDTPKGPVPGPASNGQPYNPSTSYQHPQGPMQQLYGPQSQVQMQMPQYMGNYQQQSGYSTDYGHSPQQYGMPPYMAQGVPYGVQQMNNGYPNQWGQPSQQQQPQHPVYGRQQMSAQPIPQGWMQPNAPPSSNQPMPMIPQGMQYPGVYGYPQQHHQQQQQNYVPLIQPTPTRPAVHPHSSASSSISSRSYQSYHDGSRPHSRGSTTSNMSATSSVRFGAMYPANQGGVYRQKASKGPMMNGVNSLTGLSTPSDKRSNRAQSPSSATTTSSRSSRQAGSISLVPPSQHPLPQRPDWAANNIPYQISPAGRPDSSGSSNTNDFPPLARNGHTGTNAEPMQVERAKSRPNGTAWNGVGARPLSQTGQAGSSSSHDLSPTSPRSKMMRTPGPLVPSPKTPGGPSALSPTSNEFPAQREDVEEVDFPRRAPVSHVSQTLFDPSASASASVSATAPGPAAASASGLTSTIPLDESSMSPEDIIEAKLAAISLREGVTIGPLPSKQNGHGPAPSYARIVKRD